MLIESKIYNMLNRFGWAQGGRGVFALVFLLTTLIWKQTTFCILSRGKEEIGLADSFSGSFY